MKIKVFKICATLLMCTANLLLFGREIAPKKLMNKPLNQLEMNVSTAISYNNATIDGIDIFYREAGSPSNPTILLLHGFPTSSHMFRNLIPLLAKNYHVVAPDYPGFGFSGMPDRKKFNYSFDAFATIVDKLLNRLNIDTFAMYVFDYGAPVGFRLFAKNPEKITAIISQNGNAYNEGLASFWDPIRAYWKTHGNKEREALRWLTSIKATKWQYQNGVPHGLLKNVSPDSWHMDQSLLDRSGNQEIQLDLLYDYKNNLPLYQKWQKLFQKFQPPLLAVWGKNDEIFVAPGAQAFKKDLPNAEIHLLDTGHFALETHGNEIGARILDFLGRKLKS